MNSIWSPLTGNTQVKLLHSLDVATIINNYENELNIDVRRFFSDINQIDIYECLQSGLQFYYPFTLAGDAAFYAKLSETYKGYYSPWKWEHSHVYNSLKPRMKVLEIGCGYGYFLQKLKQLDIDCIGLELNDKAVEYGKEHLLPILNEDLAVHAQNHKEKYDVVCAFQVYEHVSNLRQMLEQAVACLKQGGILALGVPNNDSYLLRNDIYHTLNLPPHHTLRWNPVSLGYLPQILPLEKITITTEPANKNHKSSSYRLHLQKFINKSKLTTLIHTLTRPIVKQLPLFTEGATVIGIFRKI
jgi:2-polyprenyl-3-methyl-5-hydroxy-6-metoxy-1,4-benzoquinol methylase